MPDIFSHQKRTTYTRWYQLDLVWSLWSDWSDFRSLCEVGSQLLKLGLQLFIFAVPFLKKEVWKECHFRKKSAKPIFFIETKTSFLTKKSQTSQKIGDSNPENENPIEKPQVRSPLALWWSILKVKEIVGFEIWRRRPVSDGGFRWFWYGLVCWKITWLKSRFFQIGMVRFLCDWWWLDVWQRWCVCKVKSWG